MLLHCMMPEKDLPVAPRIPTLMGLRELEAELDILLVVSSGVEWNRQALVLARKSRVVGRCAS